MWWYNGPASRQLLPFHAIERHSHLLLSSVTPLLLRHLLLQVDIDPFSEKGWEFTEASLRLLCERGGARLIRLDAFGFVSKKAGTTCFMQVRLVADDL
jgi:hypothetical protein